MNRRRFLQLTGTTAIGLSFGAAACSSPVTGRVLRSDAPLPEPFTVPLPIPPVSKPTRMGDADLHQLTLRKGEVEILPGMRTEIWGYNGQFPGPTIVSRRGRRTVVRHTNRLPVPIVTHLHGGRTPPEDDGYPIDLVVPEGAGHTGHKGMAGGRIAEGSRDYTYPMDQRASTLWYHDHRMDFTGPQVWRGLAGFHLITDEVDDALPLPDGDRDIPLMISDRAFDRDGQLKYPSVDDSLLGDPGVEDDFHEGVLGDVILVNGAPWPVLEVEAVRYRFRLLNASNARRYDLELEPRPANGAPFVQIASDGGLLAAPVALNRVPIAQAERFEVIIDFSAYQPGATVTMVNKAAEGTMGRVMRFKVVRKASDDSRIPDKLSDLSDYDALTPDQAVTTRKISFSRGGQKDGMEVWVINGQLFTPDFIVAKPKLDSTEIWEFSTDAHHPVHVHLVHFRILERSGSGNPPLRPADKGWKDTVDLAAGETVKVIAKFGPFRGKYVMHCHNLEHEDMAMMANFTVE